VRRCLPPGRDRVLEVGDDAVRTRLERLAQLALVVGRSEEKRAEVGEVEGRGERMSDIHEAVKRGQSDPA
jgi:hypothetical protein